MFVSETIQQEYMHMYVALVVGFGLVGEAAQARATNQLHLLVTSVCFCVSSPNLATSEQDLERFAAVAY